MHKQDYGPLWKAAAYAAAFRPVLSWSEHNVAEKDHVSLHLHDRVESLPVFSVEQQGNLV